MTSHSNHTTRRPSARFVVFVMALLYVSMSGSVPAFGQTLPGTVLDNTAQVAYTAPNGNDELVSSNTVSMVTTLAPTDAMIDFIRIGGTSGDNAVINTTQCVANGSTVTLPDPVLLSGVSVPAGSLQALATDTLFHAGEPLFVRLEDLDQNLDAAALDTITVEVTVDATGDAETITLSETDVNSGVFLGYLPTVSGAAVASDCQLQVSSASQIDVRYTDPNDGTDVVASSALVDPLGVVFDSSNGAPIDGAEITLINVGTGLPAEVFGDDGVSTYPSQLISGGSATDSGGTAYTFDPGMFRFPLVAPGTYRLQVIPPAGFSGPSVVPIGDLQTLNGAPFTLVPASFGGTVEISPGPIVVVDIPLDPSSAELFLQKSSSATVVAPGDFVPYELRLDNANPTSPLANVQINDQLPPGFRLVRDSVTIDGNAVADPVIDATGRGLTFELGELSASQSVQITYVTEVTNAISGRSARNVAVASGGGNIQSNVASVTLTLTEDLFANNSLLIGRVLDGSCDHDVSNDEQGVANARIYLEDGRYVVTDDSGRFHFEGLEPGAHVVQLDVDSIPEHLEVIPCHSNSRFAGRAFSQFVDLRPGALWRADFYLQEIAPDNGAIDLMLSALPREGRVEYSLDLSGSGAVEVQRLRAMVLLPDGASYVPGSARLNGAVIDNPSVAGPTLTFRLDQRSGVWADTLTFEIATDASASREQVTKAMVMFDGPAKKKIRSPLVENLMVFEPPAAERVEWTLTPRYNTRDARLSTADKTQIDQVIAKLSDAKDIRVRIEGHTDNMPIAPQNLHEYASNTILSRARATEVANYVRAALQLPPSQITVEARGESEPVADNTTAQGRARNRRVELMVWAEKIVPGAPGSITSDSKLVSELSSVAIEGASLRQENVSAVEDQVDVDRFGDPNWVEELAPGIDLLLPAVDTNLAVPSLKVAVKHAPKQRVQVLLDGEPISGIHYEGATRNQAKTVSISTWRGANIKQGDNELTVIVSDRDGAELERIVRNVHFSDGPVRAVFNAQESTLVADGRSRPVIVLDLFDREDYPARPDAIGTYSVSAPYRSMWEVDASRENQLLEVGERNPVYSVNAKGQAVIELEPTSRAGEVVFNLRFANDLRQEVRAWLKPATRDWILVALAEGTFGYNDIKDNLQNAQDDNLEEDYYDNGRVAFFAKGRVRGDYLLTLAYDTKGKREQELGRLFGSVDPDRFYTLYGDTTEQRFDAASAEKLYLKIERNQFYALFGDHETGLTVTELSRYNRSLTGLKSEYNGRNLAFNLFAAETNQAFVKDELNGDGTSGLYRLSRSPILINSEKVTIETRDRFRTEVIVDSRPMSRHLDYNIDYLQGTLFFKQPVPSRDQQLNPVFIVVDYESRDSGDDELIAGGRAVAKTANNRVEVGVSGITEGMAGGDGELFGADLKVEFRPGTELRAEYASSSSTQNGLDAEGDAYLVELKHQGERLEGTAYTREQESGFGLGQQRGTESGTRKTGFSARMRMSRRLTVIADAYTQDNLGNDSNRQVAQGELRYQGGRGSVGFGLRSAIDEDANGDKAESQQAFVNASLQLLENRLTVRGATEFAPNKNANTDFPRRTLLGLDYRLNSAITAFAEHEIASGDNVDTQTTRGGFRVEPWERAKINASVNQQATEYGPRVFANVGLVQGFQLNERVTLDAGFDHGNTIRSPDFEEFDADTPPTSGGVSEDFTAIHLGGLYRTDDWSATTRLEYRNSDSEERRSLQLGVFQEESPGRGFTLSSQIFDSSTLEGTDVLSADVRMGWSFRPFDSKWAVFNRLDLGYNELTSTQRNNETWKVVNNLNANWAYSLKTQYDFQYGAKFVRAQISDNTYTGFSDLIGVSMRHDLSSRFDVGMHGHVRHSWRADVYDYSLGLEAGMNVAKNAWFSLGYNFDGFEDDDFSQADYLAQGPYVKFRLKADQHTFEDFRRGMMFRRQDPALNTQRRRNTAGK